MSLHRRRSTRRGARKGHRDKAYAAYKARYRKNRDSFPVPFVPVRFDEVPAYVLLALDQDKTPLPCIGDSPLPEELTTIVDITAWSLHTAALLQTIIEELTGKPATIRRDTNQGTRH